MVDVFKQLRIYVRKEESIKYMKCTNTWAVYNDQLKDSEALTILD